MSTTLTITVSTLRQPDWESLFEFADSEAAQYDHRIENSPLWKLNTQNTARLPTRVIRVLETALDVADSSSGAFDPTILPLTRIWSFDTGGVLPEQRAVEQAKSLIDYRAVSISKNRQVSIPSEYGLDLGGIAKGAVVDQLADYLNQKGYEDFLIDAGGDVLVSGLKKNKKPWIIAIRHPRNGSLLCLMPLGKEGERKAIVTSGDYERYFEENGVRYNHILDPHTGYPADYHVSVTVIADSCARADALATAAFVMGDKGCEFLEAQAHTEALLIKEENGVLKARVTSGFPISLDELDLNPE